MTEVPQEVRRVRLSDGTTVGESLQRHGLFCQGQLDDVAPFRSIWEERLRGARDHANDPELVTRCVTILDFVQSLQGSTLQDYTVRKGDKHFWVLFDPLSKRTAMVEMVSFNGS